MTAALADLAQALKKASLTAMQALLLALLGLLVALLFIIPWLLRLGALLIFVYGLFEITIAVDAIYAAFTDTVPLVALYAFVGIVQLTLFFVISALDLRLIWGAICLSGALSLWTAKHGMVYILENWQRADLFFRALPPLLFIALVATETLKAVRRREGDQVALLRENLFRWVHAALDRIDAFALSPSGNDASLESEIMEAEGGDAA